LIMDVEETEVRNDCAGEDQQQCDIPTDKLVAEGSEGACTTPRVVRQQNMVMSPGTRNQEWLLARISCSLPVKLVN
jgi:hypothetical protein